MRFLLGFLLLLGLAKADDIASLKKICDKGEGWGHGNDPSFHCLELIKAYQAAGEFELATAVLKRGCKEKSPASCYVLGKQTRAAGDRKAELDYFQKACTYSLGNYNHDFVALEIKEHPCEIMGEKYRYEEGLPRNSKKALELYEKVCCEADEYEGYCQTGPQQASACKMAGQMHEYGEGTKIDYEKAKYQYSHACSFTDDERACAAARALEGKKSPASKPAQKAASKPAQKPAQQQKIKPVQGPLPQNNSPFGGGGSGNGGGGFGSW